MKSSEKNRKVNSVNQRRNQNINLKKLKSLMKVNIKNMSKT